MKTIQSARTAISKQTSAVGACLPAVPGFVPALPPQSSASSSRIVISRSTCDLVRSRDTSVVDLSCVVPSSSAPTTPTSGAGGDVIDRGGSLPVRRRNDRSKTGHDCVCWSTARPSVPAISSDAPVCIQPPIVSYWCLRKILSSHTRQLLPDRTSYLTRCNFVARMFL